MPKHSHKHLFLDGTEQSPEASFSPQQLVPQLSLHQDQVFPELVCCAASSLVRVMYEKCTNLTALWGREAVKTGQKNGNEMLRFPWHASKGN